MLIPCPFTIYILPRLVTKTHLKMFGCFLREWGEVGRKWDVARRWGGGHLNVLCVCKSYKGSNVLLVDYPKTNMDARFM